ncbi:Fc.00g082090.m01.CDS01 [Cosmosporella sp. VM-42]
MAWWHRNKSKFFTLGVIQSHAAFALEIGFLVQTFTSGDEELWPLIMLTMIVVLTMAKDCLWLAGTSASGIEAFSPWAQALIWALTAGGFMISIILDFYLGSRFRFVSLASIFIYQLWQIIQWGILIMKVQRRLDRLLLPALFNTLALYSSVYGVLPESRVDRLLVFSTTFVLPGLVFDMLWIVKEVQALLRSSTALFISDSVSEFPLHVASRERFELQPASGMFTEG